VSVCLSVCHSRCFTETAKHRITQTTPREPRDSSFLMPKISVKLKRGHPQRRRQTQVGQVKIGDFRQITRYNSKTSTVANVVNLVQSQVYHTERPPLFAVRLPWCSATRKVWSAIADTCLISLSFLAQMGTFPSCDLKLKGVWKPCLKASLELCSTNAFVFQCRRKIVPQSLHWWMDRSCPVHNGK